jgi:hypothetical protein
VKSVGTCLAAGGSCAYFSKRKAEGKSEQEEERTSKREKKQAIGVKVEKQAANVTS